MAAGTRLHHQPYVDAATKALAYYKRQPDLVEFKSELGTLSHIFGYMMEALTELGEEDLARRGLAAAEAIQAPDGSIPAYPGVGWICSTGMAQLAIAWYRLGDRRPADAAMNYLKTLQLPSGGFYGSYGAGAALSAARGNQLGGQVLHRRAAAASRELHRCLSRPSAPYRRATTRTRRCRHPTLETSAT